MTDALSPALALAAKALQEGRLVAVPTETVYGLAANAYDARAVAAIFDLKGRPSSNPLISHFKDAARAFAHAQPHPMAARLADAFWPGPLTLVMKKRDGSALCSLVSAGLPHVALRVPAHPMMQALLRLVDFPLAAPSANPSECISPTSAQHVRGYFGGNPALSMILDGGVCDKGLESTVVGLFEEGPVLLRPGAVTRQALEDVLGVPLLSLPENPAHLLSPGQMLRHYAPKNARVRLNATHVEEGEALLAFGPTHLVGTPTLNLSEAGDLEEAAHNLFEMLSALDASGASSFAVMPIPSAGIGEAINDRLKRAST